MWERINFWALTVRMVLEIDFKTGCLIKISALSFNIKFVMINANVSGVDLIEALQPYGTLFINWQIAQLELNNIFGLLRYFDEH